MTKTERLLELMMVVYERKRFTVDELAAEFGVSYRTMLRYLQELSGMGVPLYSEPGRHGGYSITNQSSRRGRIEKSPPLTRRLVKPTTHVVGVELKAPFAAVYMANAIIPRLWRELEVRQQEIASPIAPGRMIGVVRNRNFAYHYIAGVEVASLDTVPGGMVGITLPTKAYAAYIHQGPHQREELDLTYFFTLEKLRQQNMDHDPDAYCLQVCKPGETPISTREVEIYIPLK
ncbi:GyrI-like domain-containing protein [Brevibacillus humidisoli]|uniref:GyrI-like domain-containing protein n=1 Tax=Brevibacillus humidisoli TaxID=2895522 RepID=UPI001E492CF5|nr:GyrI-like domain-containing protein [Brevibacillus humidisoli]UFJ40315.1 GyrI-like domain-containing protein [Brevibacillus humidisoli]